MCGIAGGIAFNEKGKTRLNGISRAIDTLKYRGPDRSGVFEHNNVRLGHARLSVIDVTEAASQPFSDSTNRYTIVFNGEIYNYRELRKALSDKGVEFRSQSDTEVLLYGYILEGPSFLNKLNGFFACCIYDRAEETIFLARDRMGIKPLLIYQDEDGLMFASELKALLNMGVPRVINESALYSYLQLNYIPAPASIFKNVIKMEPGSYLLVKDKRVESGTFYKIPYKPNEIKIKHDDYDGACKMIAELMDLSVQRRMISDVPLGAFLSGGVDSSIIVALASRHSSQLNTFSIGFKDEPLFDETKFAEEVALIFHTNHSAFRLSTNDLFEVLPNVLDYTDEPFADSSALAVYILSRETRKHVTVALSGDGADELYGGYIKHMAECRMRTKGMAEKLVHLGLPLWQLLPKSRNTASGNWVRQLERFAAGMNMKAADRYWQWASIAGEQDASDLLRSTAMSKENYLDLKNSYTSLIGEAGDLNDVLFADMHLVLRNDMLVKVDMMSMANSLEVRVPFLDHEHVNYVFSLPWFYKVNKHERKKILIDAFRDQLPAAAYNRPKHGFEVPLLKWFRTELRDLIHKELLSPAFIDAQGIFNTFAIEKLLKRLESNNPGDSTARVWGLIVFQHWWKKYMLNQPDPLCPEC
jgi:asparagine synthase (glutamine-hydrolysing)